MTTLGNREILKLEKIAFLSSRKVPPAAVMASYDWATRMCAEGTCVIGGFQSALERDVLKILLKGGLQPIVMVLARSMWRTVPTAYRAAIDAGRLLVVSPVAQTIRRVSRDSAIIRNRFVLANCSHAVFAAIDSQGSLAHLLAEFPALPHGVLANDRRSV